MKLKEQISYEPFF